MELLQLKYFLELAKTQHVSKTAERLLISQPTLSLTIKRLEDELGVKLFDRTGRSIALNEYGFAFLPHAEAVFEAIELGENEVRNLKGSHENQILVGIQTPYVWQDLTRDFLKKNPGITLGQRSIEDASYRQQLLTDEIDFCLGTLTDSSDFEKNRAFDYYEYAKGNVYIIVNEKSVLAKREHVYLLELKDEDFVCRNRSDDFQKFTDELCIRAGFKPKVALECDYTMREDMVAQGLGISFSTDYAIRWLETAGVVPVRIADLSAVRHYHIIWRKDRRFTPAMQTFYDFVKSYRIQ